MAKCNQNQINRGCRHVVVEWSEVPHPKYGTKQPYYIYSQVEVSCDRSCGGRV